MTKDDTEIVSAVHCALADKVGKERYEMWFGSSTRITLEADAWRLSVPTQFFLDWLRRNFRQDIEEACLAVLGHNLPLTFEIDAKLAGTEKPTGTTTAIARPEKSSTSRPVHIASDRHAVVVPAPCANSDNTHEPVASTFARRRFASLDSLVRGPGNRLALHSAEEAIEQPGRVSPLVVYGPTGVGKTHLLEGIWTAAKRRHLRLNALYLTAEQFTTYFLDALRTTGVPNFRHKYRGVELLLIDDLQFFAGKKATQAELLYTIDTLTRDGRQLVFAADRAPTSLTGLMPELLARLSAGLSCRIDPPDFDTRLAIARQQAMSLGMAVPEDVLTFVAENFRSHARQLSGALLKLHATNRATGRPITRALAEEALADSVTAAIKPVKLADVERAVCDIFGLDPQALRSQRRTSAVAHPRMLAMWLARKHTRAALTEIGEYFGRRSHTTVISANRQIGRWLEGAPAPRLSDHTVSVAEAVRKVEERLRVG